MYEYRNPYIVDFSEVKYYAEFHDVLMKSLDFPDYYGKNWAALWDCLTDISGEIINVKIYGLSVLREKFGDTADKLIEILKRWKHYADDEYCDITRIFIIEGNKETELT